jgi:hypothetical protein
MRFGFHLLSVIALGAAASASAQLSPTFASSGASQTANGESSSRSFLVMADENLSGDGSAVPADPFPSASGAGAAGAGHGWKHPSASKFTFDLGAGFNAPIGNDNPYITWGGNLTIGGGLRITNHLSGLVEYQFIGNKLPGAFIAAQGADTGNAHIHSITFSPVLDLFPKRVNSIYLVGNGGWYHKSTNFNTVYGYDYYGYPVYVTVDSFSSNQLGGGGGFGITHRLGSSYSSDSRLKLYAEVRYLFLNTPGIRETNGLGTTGLIPVTFGIRW